MKKPRRFVPILAVAILLTAGCSKQSARQAPQPTACKPDGTTPRPGTTVAVYVDFDPNGNSGKGKASTESRTIYMCEQDVVLWVAAHGDFDEPVFTNGKSPFDKPFKHDKKKLKSDKPKGGSARQGYDYKINLKIGGKSFDVDPRIEVMD